jgi:hypothetical protein
MNLSTWAARDARRLKGLNAQSAGAGRAGGWARVAALAHVLRARWHGRVVLLRGSLGSQPLLLHLQVRLEHLQLLVVAPIEVLLVCIAA